MTNKFYDTHAEQFINGTIDIDMSTVYERVEKQIKVGGKILDVGFGSGRDSLYFMHRGYNVVSIDNSEEIVNRGQIILHSEVLEVDVRDIAYSEEFDAVWACATMVHLNDQEFMDVLKRLVDALKPEGIIYISARYGDFEGDVQGRYMNYVDEKQIERTLSTVTNVDVVDQWIDDDLRDEFDDLQWFNIILRKK